MSGDLAFARIALELGFSKLFKKRLFDLCSKTAICLGTDYGRRKLFLPPPL